MKRGCPRHPKVADLAARLNLPKYSAVGILEMLWHFTAEFALPGDIGRFSDDAIATALCYDGPSTVLVSCLVDARWLDRCACHRLRIHDWKYHADQTVVRVLANRHQQFIKCYDDPSTMLASFKDDNSLPSPSPSPSPIPKALPTPTAFNADVTQSNEPVTLCNNKQKTEAEAEAEKKEGEVEKTASPTPISISIILDAWNNQTRVPKCLIISDKRRRILEVRLRDPFFLANWQAAIQRCIDSPFCCGENDRGWKASFDWFIQPDVVAKIMEGKYDGRKTNLGNRSLVDRNAGTCFDAARHQAAIVKLQARRKEEHETFAADIAARRKLEDEKESHVHPM